MRNCLYHFVLQVWIWTIGADVDIHIFENAAYKRFAILCGIQYVKFSGHDDLAPRVARSSEAIVLPA